MPYFVSSYFCPFAPYCWSKDVKAWAGVLTVPDGQDSGVVDNDRFLTLKKNVRFRGWTEIAECDASTASGRWSVSLVRMKTGCTGLVLVRRLVLATNSSWDGILVKRIPCCARMVVNFGGEFVLREGGPLRLLN